MVQSIQSIMGNFMFICLPSVVYLLIWMRYGSRSKKISNRTLFVLLSISIVLCELFPYGYDGGYHFDFRLTPMVLGTVYGGPLLGGALLAVLSADRYLIGGIGVSIAIITAISTYIPLVVLLRAGIWKKPQHKFITLLVSTALAPALLKTFWYPLDEAVLHTWYRILETAVILGSVYVIDFLIRYFRIQQEIRDMEKMKVISQIAASVSHEIRNPLTTVRGLLQVFKTKNLSDDKRGYLTDVALSELQSAITIITDYLTFAKPRIEKLTLLPLQEEIQHIVQVLTPYANMHQVTLASAIESDHSILGDSQQLRQCLINLAKNSIEASQNGCVDITVRQSQQESIICIKDTGCGMTKEQIDRLGTPYYSTKDKGTGLGTMVAFSLVKAMHGSIAVKSEPGVGSVFELRFPLPKPETSHTLET